MGGINISVSASAVVQLVQKWDRTKNNLEQYRALMALASAKDIELGTGGGQMVAKKASTQILENGFLGALAFAIEPKKGGGFKNPGHQSVFEAVRKYLVGISALKKSPTTEEMMFEASSRSADDLRYITSETVAYMNYLRRFAKPDKDEKAEEAGA